MPPLRVREAESEAIISSFEGLRLSIWEEDWEWLLSCELDEREELELECRGLRCAGDGFKVRWEARSLVRRDMSCFFSTKVSIVRQVLGRIRNEEERCGFLSVNGIAFLPTRRDPLLSRPPCIHEPTCILYFARLPYSSLFASKKCSYQPLPISLTFSSQSTKLQSAYTSVITLGLFWVPLRSD